MNDKIEAEKRGRGRPPTPKILSHSEPPAKSSIISDLNPPKIQEYSRSNQETADLIIESNSHLISTMKMCRDCRQNKTHEEFPYQRDAGDHLGSYCYVCKRKRENLRYAKNKLKAANLTVSSKLTISK